MAGILGFELFKELPFDIIIVLIDLVNGLLTIFFHDLGVLFEAEFRCKLSTLFLRYQLLLFDYSYVIRPRWKFQAVRESYRWSRQGTEYDVFDGTD